MCANQTTIRIELARRKMKIVDLMRQTGLARETVVSLLDGDYGKSKVETLKKVEEALPGVRFEVGFFADHEPS